MNAFLTGSRAYGLSHPGSDTDIVVLVDQQTLDALLALTIFNSRDNPGPRDPGSGDASSASMRFGNLNLIATTSKSEFDAWYEGTRRLMAEAPVTREQAVEVIKALLVTARQM